MNNDLEALQFVSNVIELKTDKKYLLVFKGNITVNQIQSVIDVLAYQNIHSIGFAIDHGDDLQVIEAPAKSERDDFWQQVSCDMTINECRVIFKKLAEHLGVAVSEWGEVDDEVKKHYSLDEAKAILAPYAKIPID